MRVRTGPVGYGRGVLRPFGARSGGQEGDRPPPGLRATPLRSGGTYLTQLGDVLDDVARLTQVRREALLSRYVGVLRFYLGDESMLDVVLDTTDVARRRDESSPVLLATGHENVIETLRGLDDFESALVA